MDSETQDKVTEVRKYLLLLPAIAKDYSAATLKVQRCCNNFRNAQNSFTRASATKMKKVIKDHPEYLQIMNDTVAKTEKNVQESLPRFDDLGSRLRDTLTSFVKEQKIPKLKKILNNVKIASKSKRNGLIENSLVPALDEFLQQHKDTIATLEQDVKKVKDVQCPNTTSFADGLKKALAGEVDKTLETPVVEEHHEEKPDVHESPAAPEEHEDEAHQNPSEDHMEAASNEYYDNPTEDKPDEDSDHDKFEPEATAADHDDNHSEIPHETTAEDHSDHDAHNSNNDHDDHDAHDENQHEEGSAEESGVESHGDIETSYDNHHSLDDDNEEKFDAVHDEKPEED